MITGWAVAGTGTAHALPLGPVASGEPMSGDGGGSFNAGSARPSENPGGPATLLSVVLMLVVPATLPRAYGRMVGDLRQGRTLLAVMAVLRAAEVALAAESRAAGTVPAAVGAAAEGKEVRVGAPLTALFGATADGAVAGAHDSSTALGGGVLIATMLLGEVSPGGVGSGLYGLLLVALLSVFLAGLALAGSFAAQRRVAVTAATLPTRGPLLGSLVGATAVGVGALSCLPVLALGPLAGGLA